jgi:hypothetical protein
LTIRYFIAESFGEVETFAMRFLGRSIAARARAGGLGSSPPGRVGSGP